MKKNEKTMHSTTLNPSMFKIDQSDLSEFSLPKKLLSQTIIPRDIKKREQKSNAVKKSSKSFEFAKEMADTEIEQEYAFLPNALGRSKQQETVEEIKQMEELVGINNTKPSNTGGGKNSDLDEVSVIMSGIHTSYDAINFFARFGSETPVKFVHLVQQSDPKSYNPYELVISKRSDPSMDYYTMSSVGIVHCSPGEPSDCTPLSSWMRQGMMFKILRNIPFYKFYLHRKIFHVWKENIRFLLFAKQRRKLADRMFYGRKNACQSILTVKKYLNEFQNVRLLNLDMKTCDKDVFFEQQKAQCVRANGKYDEAMRLVYQEVVNVQEEVMNIHNLSKQDPSASAIGYSDGAVEKAKSLVKIKQEKAEKKVMRARARMEFNTLPEFIRFVDYMCVETLVSIAVNTASLFFDELVKPRKAGIFETMVRFSSAGTSFSPTCQDIRDMLFNLLDEHMLINVSNLNRVLYIDKNDKKMSTQGPNIIAFIKENKQYRAIMANIQARVSSDFEKAEEHAQSYESIRPIYDFNASWNFEEYRSQQHDMPSLKAMLELIGNWSKELEKLRNKPIGILEVDSKRLKGELNPMREARLQEIKEYIKDIAK
jgi:dynein heavy chain